MTTFENIMLDVEIARNDIQLIKNNLIKREESLENYHKFLEIDKEWRKYNLELISLRQKRNSRTTELNNLMDDSTKTILIEFVRKLRKQIEVISNKCNILLQERNSYLYILPNILQNDVQDEKIIEQNIDDMGKQNRKHNYIDVMKINNMFLKDADTSGKGYSFYQNDLVILEMELISSFLKYHYTKGYEIYNVPYIVNQDTLKNSGQYPKYNDEMFHITTVDEQKPEYLIPTGEVPLMSIHKEANLPLKTPLKMATMTDCFRKEIGQHKNLKMLSRVHQFKKVECVIICKPQDSTKCHEELLQHCLTLVKKLKLPYRVLQLASNDIGISSSKTYDIEVYCPVSDKWLEISSCSNCTDYQTRISRIKTNTEGKSVLAHSLNSSGLAIPRLLISILENKANENGILPLKEIYQTIHEI